MNPEILTPDGFRITTFPLQGGNTDLDVLERRIKSFTSESSAAIRGVLQAGQFTVRIVRVLPNPPFVLFSAWTIPSMIRKWFHTGPAWTTPVAEVDLRIGGHYRIAIQDAAGKTYSYSGRYQEVRAPQSLAFTWVPYGDPAVETMVVLQFPSLAGRTPNWNSAIWDCCTNRCATTMKPFGTYASTGLRRRYDAVSGSGHSAASTPLFSCCLHGPPRNCSTGALLGKAGLTGTNNMHARHGQKDR